MITKFAERLKELRIDFGLTHAQLAEKIQVNPRTISYWELGQRECNLEQLMQLAVLLKTTTDYLLGLED